MNKKIIALFIIILFSFPYYGYAQKKEKQKFDINKEMSKLKGDLNTHINSEVVNQAKKNNQQGGTARAEQNDIYYDHYFDYVEMPLDVKKKLRYYASVDGREVFKGLSSKEKEYYVDKALDWKNVAIDNCQKTTRKERDELSVAFSEVGLEYPDSRLEKMIADTDSNRFHDFVSRELKTPEDKTGINKVVKIQKKVVKSVEAKAKEIEKMKKEVKESEDVYNVLLNLCDGCPNTK